MRRYPDPSGNLHLVEGDYGQDGSGVWHVRPKGQHPCSIAHHKVTKHKNGTVTVVPSIVIKGLNDERGWHGFLIKGQFSEVKTGGGKR